MGSSMTVSPRVHIANLKIGLVESMDQINSFVREIPIVRLSKKKDNLSKSRAPELVFTME